MDTPASHLERIARDGYTILERVIEPELVYLQRRKRSSTSGQRATPSRVRIPCASTTCSCTGSSTSRFPSTRGCSRSSRASSIRDAWCRLCRRSASTRASARAPTLRTSKIYGMTNSFRKGGGLVDAPGRGLGRGEGQFALLKALSARVLGQQRHQDRGRAGADGDPGVQRARERNADRDDRRPHDRLWHRDAHHAMNARLTA